MNNAPPGFVPFNQPTTPGRVIAPPQTRLSFSLPNGGTIAPGATASIVSTEPAAADSLVDQLFFNSISAMPLPPGPLPPGSGPLPPGSPIPFDLRSRIIVRAITMLEDLSADDLVYTDCSAQSSCSPPRWERHYSGGEVTEPLSWGSFYRTAVSLPGSAFPLWSDVTANVSLGNVPLLPRRAYLYLEITNTSATPIDLFFPLGFVTLTALPGANLDALGFGTATCIAPGGYMLLQKVFVDPLTPTQPELLYPIQYDSDTDLAPTPAFGRFNDPQGRGPKGAPPGPVTSESDSQLPGPMVLRQLDVPAGSIVRLVPPNRTPLGPDGFSYVWYPNGSLHGGGAVGWVPTAWLAISKLPSVPVSIVSSPSAPAPHRPFFPSFRRPATTTGPAPPTAPFRQIPTSAATAPFRPAFRPGDVISGRRIR